MVTRIQFASIAIALTVLPVLPAHAQSTGCVLEVAGRTYIDGQCDHRLLTDGQGSFQITGPDGRHFAYVHVNGDRATAHWNGESAESSAHDPLGELRRSGACWVNDGARICVSAATAAAGAPFGRWDCGVMTFTLDAERYDASGPVAVAGIERITETAWGVELRDGYRFAMFDVTPDSLTWHSPQSGDTFECRRQ